MGCSHSKPEDASSDEQQGPSASAPQSLVGKLQTIGKTMQTGQDRMRNVFAKPLALKDSDYKPPVIPKNEADEKFLKTALPKNFVFENLNQQELEQLVNAMEPYTAQAGSIIIKQGDDGDYLYVIKSGSVEFIVNGTTVGQAGAGASFGELALLYTTPRAATVKAVAEIQLFRVDQTVFRYILQHQTVSTATAKTKLLKKVTFLKDLDDYNINKLAQVMERKELKAGHVLMKKGDVEANHFYILDSGTIECTDIGAGDTKYEDFTTNKAGDYFGERALVTGEPRAATVICKTDCVVYTIDKKTFETVLGNFKSVIQKSLDKRKLSSIKIIADSKLSDQGLTSLAQMVEDRTFIAGNYLFEAGKTTEAALYLVRSGNVKIKDGKTIGPDEYIGDDQLKADVGVGANYHIGASSTTKPTYSALAEGEVVCGVLTLAACRRVLDTRLIGQPEAASHVLYDSIIDQGVALKDLKRHTILGAGTFGQVWLVSRSRSDGTRSAYALKVQSKYELCKDGQAKAVVYEKTIMSRLHHPFLIGLVNTYQDDKFVYILLDLVQGGELYSYIHTPFGDSLKEPDARFYAACIAEGLGYMHRRSYVYRDLKPENVLIDQSGYCVVIDFGFAKFVPTKTFTLCGTPLYLAPEVILNRGHNQSADHWSLGILIFEMLTGETPFYKSGMEQMDLFRAIVRCRFQIPSNVSPEASQIISALVTKDPSQRLGALAEGEDGIPTHPWFDKVSFDELRLKRIKPPKIPKIADPLDATNFEDWSHLDDKTKMKFPKLTKDQMKIFEGF